MWGGPSALWGMGAWGVAARTDVGGGKIEQQIPFGDDRKKNKSNGNGNCKSNDNCKCRSPSGMTTRRAKWWGELFADAEAVEEVEEGDADYGVGGGADQLVEPEEMDGAVA
jgi:hypothetical protein